MKPAAPITYSPDAKLDWQALPSWPVAPRKASRRWSRMQRDAALRRYLALGDVIACATAVLLATEFVDGVGLRWALLAAVVLVVPLAKAMGLYDRDELLLNKSTLDEGPLILRLAAACTLWTWLLSPLVLDDRFTAAQVLVMWGSLIFALVAARVCVRTLFNVLSSPERCMIVGEQAACEHIRGKLEGSRSINAEIVLTLPFESPEQERREMESLARSEGLERLASHHDLQRMIIAPLDSDADHIRDIVQTANRFRLRVSVVPRMLEVVGSSVAFDDVNGLTVMGVKIFGLSRSSRAMKRALDLVIASIALVVLSPLLLVIAIAIKRDSRGPVLFRQPRVGQDGEVFSVLKFRTMVDGAHALRPSLAEHNEADGLFKIADDPRITRVGRLLRQLSFDEFPQLINVLRGEMSLVGPRPLVPDEDVRVAGHDRERLALKPGITGRWQILGSARIPLAEMAKLDYLYVANWSLWGDAKILLRTVPYVLARRGM